MSLFYNPILPGGGKWMEGEETVVRNIQMHSNDLFYKHQICQLISARSQEFLPYQYTTKNLYPIMECGENNKVKMLTILDRS